jgi:uncharacterized protein (TIGR00730 family)
MSAAIPSGSQIASVCVYCGSRDGADPAYRHAAEDFGRSLATAGLRLVYGAGDVGLMGAVARACQSAGGETFGVIPQHLVDREVAKRDLVTFVITETMHERKKVMLCNSDAVVLLPGGMGSLDELCEAITWRQLGLHDKPIVILNINGYWNPLRTLIDHIVDDGFAGTEIAKSLIWVETAAEATAALR